MCIPHINRINRWQKLYGLDENTRKCTFHIILPDSMLISKFVFFCTLPYPCCVPLRLPSQMPPIVQCLLLCSIRLTFPWIVLPWSAGYWVCRLNTGPLRIVEPLPGYSWPAHFLHLPCQTSPNPHTPHLYWYWKSLPINTVLYKLKL